MLIGFNAAVLTCMHAFHNFYWIGAKVYRFCFWSKIQFNRSKEKINVYFCPDCITWLSLTHLELVSKGILWIACRKLSSRKLPTPAIGTAPLKWPPNPISRGMPSMRECSSWIRTHACILQDPFGPIAAWPQWSQKPLNCSLVKADGFTEIPCCMTCWYLILWYTDTL